MLNTFAVHLHPICCLKNTKTAFWRCRLPQISSIINFLACENVKSIVQKLWLKTVKSPRLFVRGVMSLSEDERKASDAQKRQIGGTKDWSQSEVIGGDPESLIRPDELMSLTSGYWAGRKHKEQRDAGRWRTGHRRFLTTFSFGQPARRGGLASCQRSTQWCCVIQGCTQRGKSKPATKRLDAGGFGVTWLLSQFMFNLNLSLLTSPFLNNWKMTLGRPPSLWTSYITWHYLKLKSWCHFVRMDWK